MRLTPATTMIAAGAVTLSLSFGVRSIFGIVLGPVSEAHGWPREVFSLSIALQSIVWGLAQPVFGMIADRWGDRRALWLGLGIYLAGMALAAIGTEPWMEHLGAGVLVGSGIAGTSFGIVLSVVGRATPPERRSAVLGLTASLGSVGQMLCPLLAGWLTAAWGWQATLVVMGLLLLPIALCIPFLEAPAPAVGEPEVPLGEVLRRAAGHPSFVLLVLGFFVCGFHVSFIAAHLPTYVAQTCGSVTLGAATISLIGLANIVGTFAGGQLGQWFPKPYILSAIYALRAAVIAAFVLLPVTPVMVVVFSLAIGMIWLSTVPLTTALVATMFGPRALGTLYGIVYLGHQAGSFLGVWLGGLVYDRTGSYGPVWAGAIALGVFSAIVHLPVRERPWAPASLAAA